LPPEEMLPTEMMIKTQLAEQRDWGHTPLQLAKCQLDYADGEGITVAVLDTGIDLTHPDLQDRIKQTKDFTGSRSGPSDVQGHGTHCAGIIAASAQGQGIIGAAPKAGLVIGKVLGDNGSGSSAGIAAGVRWATDQNVNIISMSLGGPSPDAQTKAAIQAAVAKGILVVCAAGNEGPRDGTVGYPGGYNESICVGAVDPTLTAANFSSRGPALDVATPGVEILSTYPGGRYSKLSGTSMACPYTAGCLALYLSYLKRIGKPFPSYAEVLELMRVTARELGVPGIDNTYGFGFLDLLTMLERVKPAEPEKPPDIPPILPPEEGVWVDVTSAELVAKGVKKVRVYF
jgi:subtilisin